MNNDDSEYVENFLKQLRSKKLRENKLRLLFIIGIILLLIFLVLGILDSVKWKSGVMVV